MGFIKAFTGAFGGVFADQWLDPLTVPRGISPMAAFLPAVHEGRNAGRGSNTKGLENIISNGSKIMAPDGYGLVSFQDGRITGFVAEPGRFEFRDQDPSSQSVFAGGGAFGQVIRNTWEHIKFGGRPGAMQQVFFVSLKELPDNHFDTQSEIYWGDAYPGAQVGATTSGTYTLRIVDPPLFISSVIPGIVIANNQVFDFDDIDNPVSEQLFTEMVACLGAAFSKCTNDPERGNRITQLQQDSTGFAKSLSAAIEENYQWRSGRGLLIEYVVLVAIEHDADTRELLPDVKKADVLRGDRGAPFMQQSVARGIQSADENGGGQGLVGMDIGVPMMGGMMGGSQQPTQQPTRAQPAPPGQPAQATSQEDPVTKLKQMKESLDARVVSQEEFDTLKKRLFRL